MRPIDLSCYAGAERIPVHPVRPGALRDGDQQRQAAATRDGAIAPDITAAALGTRRPVTALAGTSRPSTLAGEQTRWVGHDGMLLGGMVASLMTFPERGLVVAVISNTSYADTPALALKIAQAFVEPRR